MREVVRSRAPSCRFIQLPSPMYTLLKIVSDPYVDILCVRVLQQMHFQLGAQIEFINASLW